MLKDGREDYIRHQQDKKTNARKCLVWNSLPNQENKGTFESIEWEKVYFCFKLKIIRFLARFKLVI